jgi:hypothetical protein
MVFCWKQADLHRSPGWTSGKCVAHHDTYSCLPTKLIHTHQSFSLMRQHSGIDRWWSAVLFPMVRTYYSTEIHASGHAFRYHSLCYMHSFHHAQHQFADLQWVFKVFSWFLNAPRTGMCVENTHVLPITLQITLQHLASHQSACVDRHYSYTTYSWHMLCCCQCVCKKQKYNTIHVHMAYTYHVEYYNSHTHSYFKAHTHTHCMPCMHACMHTNILELNCSRSSPQQHHCMHSKISRVEIKLLNTGQNT